MIETSRRELIKAAGAAAVASVSKGAPAARPKVGCTSWCFHGFGAGEYPDKAIDILGEMGADCVELIINQKEDIPKYWDVPATIDRLRKQIERNKLEISQVAVFYPVIRGLTSLDAATRKVNMDLFETSCRIVSRLGAGIINVVAPWATEFQGPGKYLPRYYEIKEPKPGEKFHYDIDPGFNFDRVWKRYIETTKECLERAKKHRLRMTIEHHTHTMIPDADSFLRLWDAIRDPALGYNLDTGWTLSQREYPPAAIHKVKDHLMHLHIRDIDGLMRAFPYVGEGVMDFKHIAATLKIIGFRGYISLEQDKNAKKDMVENCKRYLAMMREYLG